MEVLALKLFTMEQLDVIKKFMEDFRSENVTTNNVERIENLKEEMLYRRNENIKKRIL